MAPKKKTAGGGKKKGKAGVDEEDLKSFNVQQRDILIQLLSRLDSLQEENAQVREETR